MNVEHTLSRDEVAVLGALYELGRDGASITRARIARRASVAPAAVELALVSLERRQLAWAARARLTLAGLATAARISVRRGRARRAA